MAGAAGLMAAFTVLLVALAFTATPAQAFSEWQHAGATTCTACHKESGTSDETCTVCHRDFRSYPGKNCWSCHVPGEDTSHLSTPSSACGQECHLWNAVQKQHMVPSSHGVVPHLGAGGDCLACHPRSLHEYNPGDSPHHSGVATGFTAASCTRCHAKPQKHARKVTCVKCHVNAPAFHTFSAKTPGYKRCNACHNVKHAGKRVAQNRCAACHKGAGGRPVQHAATITKTFACGGCHKKALHARAVSKKVGNCRSCHKGKFHARQARPAKSVCTRCHSRAQRHSGRFQCTLCHRRAVHNRNPSAINR